VLAYSITVRKPSAILPLSALTVLQTDHSYASLFNHTTTVDLQIFFFFTSLNLHFESKIIY